MTELEPRPQRNFSRRKFLIGTFNTAGGLVTLALVGCDEKDEREEIAPTASLAANLNPTSSPTPENKSIVTANEDVTPREPASMTGASSIAGPSNEDGDSTNTDSLNPTVTDTSNSEDNVNIEDKVEAVEAGEKLFPDPYSAALDWFSRKFDAEKDDFLGVQSGRDCRADKEFCIIEEVRGDNVVGYFGGPYATDGSPILFVGKEENGWKVAYFDEISESLNFPLPGSDVKVKGAGDCLRVRTAPSLSSDKLDCLLDDTRAKIDEGPVYRDGYVWLHLEGRGWSVVNYLATTFPDYSQ